MRGKGQKEEPMVPRGLVWPVRHRLDVDCVVQRRGTTRPGIVVGVALDHVLVEWDDGRTIEVAASLVLADLARLLVGSRSATRETHGVAS